MSSNPPTAATSKRKAQKKLPRLKSVDLKATYKASVPTQCVEQLISLSDIHVEHVGELTHQKIQYFYEYASYFLTAETPEVANNIRGFLVGFCEGSRFASPYYAWISKYYERFIFVERLLIEESCQRKEVALHLLWPLMVLSAEYKMPIVTAVNYDPCNQAGLGFFLDGLDCYLVGNEQINKDLEVVYFERTFSLEDLKVYYERLQGKNKVMKISEKDVPEALKQMLRKSKKSGKNHARANKEKHEAKNTL